MDRNKDVMVYRFDPTRKYFLVSLHLENKPGALGNLANLLGVRGVNILEGFFGGVESGPVGKMSFFLESTNPRMNEDWLKDFLSTLVYVSDVQVRTGHEGWLSDTFNFPITWNSGDRAVLMRVEALRGMLDAVESTPPGMGKDAVHAQGIGYGRKAWEGLLLRHRPNTKEGLAEMLHLFNATGWAKLVLLDFNPDHHRAKVRMTEGFECTGLSTGEVEGYFIGGVLAGALSAYFGTDVDAHETRCLSRGDPCCEFEVAPLGDR